MLAELSIIPLGKGTSLSEELAEILKLIDASGLAYQLTPSGTCIEGDWDEVMALIKACVMSVAEAAPRVSVVIKVDHRPGVGDALRGKVEAIEERLAER